jgi:hypothetical protein
MRVLPMSIHWPSFVLGLAALPTLVAVALIGWSVLNRFTHGARSSGRALGAPSGSASPPRRLEPLQFNPRLIGQMRSSLEPNEDSAEVS